MASQLVGMGCTLKTIGGRIVITEVKAGGGAAVSGNVKPYDVLVAVDGVRLSSTDHAKKLLLGAAGTSFVAGLERGGASVHVTIWRGGIQNLAKVEAQRSQGVTSQDRAAASRPLPSADQIRAFSAAALFDECCCPGRAIPLSQKLDLFNLLALRAQELALHMRSERIDSSTRGLPQISQELRAISASCAKIQVTLDCIDVTGADRDYRKMIIKLCEAVASECDDALR